MLSQLTSLSKSSVVLPDSISQARFGGCSKQLLVSRNIPSLTKYLHGTWAHLVFENLTVRRSINILIAKSTPLQYHDHPS
jgi:hypothetical protein